MNDKESDIFLFDDIFTKYYPRLCDFARSLLQDERLAEDIVQDAFVVFLEQRGQISNQSLAIKGFLYTTVKFACLNKFRRDNVILKFLNSKGKSNDIDTNTIVDSIIHSEVLGKLNDALAKIPAGSALVLKLGYIEGLKNEEIAKELNISIHTVKSQKQRGLKLLREKLDPNYFSLFLLLMLK